MKIQTLLSAVVLVMCCTGPADAAQNLVVNGSFEQGGGSFAGWKTRFGDQYTYISGNGETGRLFGQASHGIWSAQLGAFESSGGATLSQVLPTVSGQAYTLSFDLANSNGAGLSNAFSVSIGGVQRLSLTDLPDQDYTRETIGFVATGSSSLLSISARNDPYYLQLDNVVVAPVPEPATASMALVAMASIGLAVVRRRRR